MNSKYHHRFRQVRADDDTAIDLPPEQITYAWREAADRQSYNWEHKGGKLLAPERWEKNCHEMRHGCVGEVAFRFLFGLPMPPACAPPYPEFDFNVFLNLVSHYKVDVKAITVTGGALLIPAEKVNVRPYPDLYCLVEPRFAVSLKPPYYLQVPYRWNYRGYASPDEVFQKENLTNEFNGSPTYALWHVHPGFPEK